MAASSVHTDCSEADFKHGFLLLPRDFWSLYCLLAFASEYWKKEEKRDEALCNFASCYQLYQKNTEEYNRIKGD